MQNIEALVRARRSVRTFEERELSEKDLASLRDFMDAVDNPYGLPVEFRLLNAGEKKLGCPVVVGTELFVATKMKVAPYLNEAVGYSFEKLVLYAQSIGVGTVWICGTMDRPAFERAVELGEDEVMPCVSPLGYPAGKMSIREAMMRKGIKADERIDFEKLFFAGDFEHPLKAENSGALAMPLEMLRLAPSAVNKQPWRAVVCEKAVHFYLKRSKGFGGGRLDMQKIDMGIALCHFELAAKEAGLAPRFGISDPGLDCPGGEEYIASYRLG